jgi:hypothetical protein
MFNRLFGSRNTTQPSSLPTVLPTAAPQPPLASAIASKNLAEVERQLLDRDLAAETLHTALDQACRDKSCPDLIKLALLQHPACDKKGALGLAIRHDDLYLAGETLKLGGVPERDQIGSSSKRMRRLLTTFRRRTTLYPPGASRNNQTVLDRKLRDGDDGGAEYIFIRMTAGLTWRDKWSDSVQRDRRDLQSAFLLGGKADRDRFFRLREVSGSTINDPAVRQIMKEIAQYSPRRGEPRNFNLKVEGVNCMAFVEDMQAKRAGDPALKADYEDYKDLETIAARFKAPPGQLKRLHKRVSNVLTHAAEVHLINNSKLFSFIAAQLEAMEKNGESARQILWNSTNHIMDLGLRIKYKNGKKIYVIKLYDPNSTTSHVRSALSSLEAVEALTLNQILSGDDLIKIYWPEGKGLSTMTVRPPEEEISAYAQRPVGAAAGRRLTSALPPEEVDGTAIWHMLDNGFSGDLRSLKKEIAGRPESELSALLGTRAGPRGTPGLCRALKNGHADVIRAFGEIVAMVPQELRGDLLACKTSDGTPGLAIALSNGYADAIRAFGEIVAMVPEKLRGDLLTCKISDGTPGLAMALQQGHAGAIEAFGKSLSLLPDNLRKDIVACKDKNGIPGFSFALEAGNKEAILAYGELLKTILPPQRAPLLAAKEANGSGGLAWAMVNGHVDAVHAYGTLLLDCIPPAQFAEVLLAARAEGHFATEWALHNGHREAFVAFCNILRDACSKALQEGDAEAVRALEKVLKELPSVTEAAIISATDGLAAMLHEPTA